MRSESQHRYTIPRIYRSGFTLVEMLVSVALVMLMMTMFATIFQMATESATKQRIIAETDQRSRQLTTILRADFAKRSFRNTFPFLPNESSTRTKVPFAARAGYVYISCNNPWSDQDDMIQFTVDARQVQTNPDDSRFYGAAALLFDAINGTVDGTNPSLPFSPNQPDADDGELRPNGTSSSDAAEISLFLRGGNLIRRIMLIRDPLPVAGEDLETQPKSFPGNPYFLTSATSVSGSGLPEFYLAADPLAPQDDFWRYFDFSAVPANMANVPDGVSFVGIDALSNEGSPTSFSFGKPNFRFGFNPVTGLSREHESAAASARFIGRYLQAETSSADFNWPNSSSSIGNPMDVTNSVSMQLDSGLVSAFRDTSGRGGPRRVEDVLMSNVREFKIELWDSRLERWVVPGHSSVRGYDDGGGTVYSVAGDYHIWRNMQRVGSGSLFTYGPLQIPGDLTGEPHVFDTWHPEIIREVIPNGTNDVFETQAPYMPLKYYPPCQDGSITRSGITQYGPSPSNTWFPDIRSEYDPIAGDTDVNQGYWETNTPYQIGDVVFANNLTPGWDAAPADNVFDWEADKSDIPEQSVHIAYRCVGTTNGANPPRDTPAGTSGSTVPPWQSPGLTFLDNDLLWQGFQNYQPLKSVRLTISFIEPNSETPKQLTLVLPLTDDAR